MGRISSPIYPKHPGVFHCSLDVDNKENQVPAGERVLKHILVHHRWDAASSVYQNESLYHWKKSKTSIFDLLQMGCSKCSKRWLKKTNSKQIICRRVNKAVWTNPRNANAIAILNESQEDKHLFFKSSQFQPKASSHMPTKPRSKVKMMPPRTSQMDLLRKHPGKITNVP